VRASPRWLVESAVNRRMLRRAHRDDNWSNRVAWRRGAFGLKHETQNGNRRDEQEAVG